MGGMLKNEVSKASGGCEESAAGKSNPMYKNTDMTHSSKKAVASTHLAVGAVLRGGDRAHRAPPSSDYEGT